MFQTKVVERNKTSILCLTTFIRKSVVCEITWKNTAEPGRPQMTIWRMRIACWIPKTKYTSSEYVILIVFLLQQWLHERASMLRCTYIAASFFIINIEIIQRRWQINENRALMEWQQGKTYVFGERLPHWHLVHHKFHMVSHGIKPGLLRWETVDSPPEVWHGLDAMYFDREVAAHQRTPKRCFAPKYTT